jgi:mycothiol synthase
VSALPAGFELRPVAPDDAEGILAVGVARDVADVGYPDWSIEAVRDEMGDSDGVVVADAVGAIVAFALLGRGDARVAVHPDAEGQGIGSFLVDEVERRATGETVRQEVMTGNRAAVDLLERSGYALDQRYWRMVRELDGSEAEPVWPDGIAARRFERGRDDRAAYEIVSAAMREVPGNTERSFEEWSARSLGEAFAPELSVITTGGVALCERWEDGDGYVDYLAVASDWRGRGLGRALLQAALQGFAQAGLKRGVLWVNGRNESATQLYRSAGMEVAFSADRYAKRLDDR